MASLGGNTIDNNLKCRIVKETIHFRYFSLKCVPLSANDEIIIIGLDDGLTPNSWHGIF